MAPAVRRAEPAAAPAPARRIAMWSGPRNISTAMMRSWGSRSDCVVVDEPLYACYLERTGLDHPGRADIISSQSTDWRAVIRKLTESPLPDGKTVFFQKHMAQHLLPGVERQALSGLSHAFLIRDPAEVLISYAKVRGEPTMDDLGMPQQVELYETFGGPVIDARDVLLQPEATLRALCDALDLEFDPAMLTWSPGRRTTDGVWGQHWYDGVWRSTAFAAYRPPSAELQERLRPLLEQCQPYYDTLASRRLCP